MKKEKMSARMVTFPSHRHLDCIRNKNKLIKRMLKNIYIHIYRRTEEEENKITGAYSRRDKACLGVSFFFFCAISSWKQLYLEMKRLSCIGIVQDITDYRAGSSKRVCARFFVVFFLSLWGYEGGKKMRVFFSCSTTSVQPKTTWHVIVAFSRLNQKKNRHFHHRPVFLLLHQETRKLFFAFFFFFLLDPQEEVEQL